MIVQAQASVELVIAALTARLDEAPGFFRGSDVRVGVEGGALRPGCLARLDELATRFDLRIVEVFPYRPKPEPEAIPEANLAAGSAPSASRDDELAHAELSAVLASFDGGETASTSRVAPAAPVASEIETAIGGSRLVIGPIRSGVVLEHIGHLFVFGDVNPGAEVRASGGIIVLGRMRGTAHAGIGQDHGFILALCLEPQQLRIGRMVARAADDARPTDAEIAYVSDNRIVVERYTGKLPRNLATSL
jgi:septum site-determining protein MinC